MDGFKGFPLASDPDADPSAAGRGFGFKSHAEVESQLPPESQSFLVAIDNFDDLSPGQKQRIKQEHLDSLLPPAQQQAIKAARETASREHDQLRQRYLELSDSQVRQQLDESERLTNALRPPVTDILDIQLARQSLGEQHLNQSRDLKQWFDSQADRICDRRDAKIASIRDLSPPETLAA